MNPVFAEAAATVGVTGICGSAIIEVVADKFLTGIISEDGVVDGSMMARSPRILVNGRTYSYLLRDGEPRDYGARKTMCAPSSSPKAALYAGVKLLMDKQGITHVDRIGLAGAFGTFIDPKYAMVLGLIPDCALDAGEGGRQVPPASAHAWHSSTAAIAARSRKPSAKSRR